MKRNFIIYLAIISCITFSQATYAQDSDGDGALNNVDMDSDNDGIPNSLDGCSTTDIENTIGFGNDMTWTSYNIDGTTVTYGPSMSGGYARAYTGGNIGSAIEVRGDEDDALTNFKIDAKFSTDIEHVTFKITDFDYEEEATLYIFDENDNLYDLNTVGVVSVGSYITQTGNTFTTSSSSINIDGNNNAEDQYGSVLFYFPGKVSRIDVAGVIKEDGSLRVSEYNYCLNDYDNDGVKDFMDLDSDNDGIPDIVEAGGTDSDNNGIADSIVDNNNNGIPDQYDTNCTGTDSGSGNADSVISSISVTSASEILGVQDSMDAIIAPSGSIIVDLTDNVIANSLIIVKHRRASGVDGVPFTVEQSTSPSSGFTNNNSYSTNNSTTFFSASYRVSSSNARYIRITNTDTDQDLGIDYLSYDFGSLTDCSGTIGNSIPLLNSDTDSNSNRVDFDSDNDGIPDNIEAQPTNGYIALSGGVNSNGILNVYASNLIQEDTDGDGIYDFIDTDSDNDGTPDIQENGMANSLANSDSDNDGLDDNFEGSNLNDFDANDEINNPSDLSILPDSDGDLAIGGDLDYRDSFNVNPPASATLDFDGVDDYVVGTPVLSKFNQSNTDGVTIMGWIKSDSDAADSATKFVFGERESVELFISDEDIRAYIHIVSSTGTNQTRDVYRATTGIERGIWRHVTITVDFANNRASLLLDGRWVFRTNLFDAVKFQSADTAANEDFRMGNDPALNATRFFKGAIDEVRIFDKLIDEEELKEIIFQEIEDNAGSVRGAVIHDNLNSVDWSDLQLYYPLSNLASGYIKDESNNSHTAHLFNITTMQEQTAPMPYTTKQDGLWSDKNTWTYGDVWFIPGDEVSEAATYGDDEVVDWGIYHINNNVTLNTSMSVPNSPRALKGIEALGLIIDQEDSSNNPISFTIGDGTEDLQVNVSKYMELNGTLDLSGDSQLIQGLNSDLVTSSTGKILRRQEGNSNVFWYNYWSSPVGSLGATTLSNNNDNSNNGNNSTFNLSMLKDGTGTAMEFTSAFDEVGKISNRWLYSFLNGQDYYGWSALTPASGVLPGVGYTQKGTGVANANGDQEYIFEGKPNNGTILVAADDVDGDTATESDDGSRTTTLIGNPYPSTLDARQFIADNAGTIKGTILLWEQWEGDSHILADYQGGYGYINAMTTERAYQYQGVEIADAITGSGGRGIKTPSFYIPVGQGFFVEVINDGNIEFNNGQRIFMKESDASSNPEDGSVFFRNTSEDNSSDEETEEENPYQLIRMEFSTSAGASRRFVLGFSDTATDGFDYGLDGGHIADLPEDDMGSLFDGKQFVIQAFAPITPEKEIDLNLNASGNHTYSIKAVELSNIDENQEVYLRDNLTGTYFDLRNDQAYEFTSESGMHDDRFDMVFRAEESLNNDVFETNNVIIYMNNLEDKLYIKGLDQDAKSLTLTNMLGQAVMTRADVSNNTMQNGISIQNLSSGIYVVTVKTEDNKQLSKKIILE